MYYKMKHNRFIMGSWTADRTYKDVTKQLGVIKGRNTVTLMDDTGKIRTVFKHNVIKVNYINKPRRNLYVRSR